MPGRAALVILILLLGDTLSFALAFGLATYIRYALIPVIGGVLDWEAFLPLLYTNLLCVLVTYALTGLYPGFGRTAVEEMRQIFYSLLIGYGILGLAVYLQKIGPNFSRSVFIMGWVFACLFNLVIRIVIRNRASLQSWWGVPVIILGHAVEASDVVQRLLHSRRLGLKPVLVLDESCPASGDAPTPMAHVHGVPIIHSRSEMEEIAVRHHIQYAVFIEPSRDAPVQERQDIRWLSKFFPSVMVVLANSQVGSLWVRTVDLEGRLTLQASYHLLNRQALVTKRLFDLVIGGLAAFLAAPLLVLLAVMIRLDSPGPVFYTQERLGLNGKPIRYLKFRSMQMDADQRLHDLMRSDAQARLEYETYHKLKKDPRVTRVGRLIRKFSLDELPQLFHVLTGEMSLVGPRAYMPSELADMGSYAELILQVRPGLTGWWQVMGRHATTFQQRLQLDEYYLSNWSLWLDIYILLKTFWVVPSGVGV